MAHETQSPKAFQRGRHLSKPKKDEQGNPIPTRLDQFNDQLIGSRGLFLHPTKGYRRASTTPTVCSDIVTGIKGRGVRLSTAEMGEQVRLARLSQYGNKTYLQKYRRTTP